MSSKSTNSETQDVEVSSEKRQLRQSKDFIRESDPSTQLNSKHNPKEVRSILGMTFGIYR